MLTVKLMDSPVVLDWGPACCTEVEPQVVAMPRASDTCNWHILSCPWWLDVKEEDDQLTFWPRNCGRHQGQVRLEIDGVESCIEVRSCVRPTWVLAIWTACKVLLVGAATIVLAVILGVASLLTVSAAAGGKAAGPVMFFGLLFTPGTGLTIWGTVMGALLAPCLAMTAANDAAQTAAELPELLSQSERTEES